MSIFYHFYIELGAFALFWSLFHAKFNFRFFGCLFIHNAKCDHNDLKSENVFLEVHFLWL